MIELIINIIFLVEFLIVVAVITYSYYWMVYKTHDELNEKLGFYKLSNIEKDKDKNSFVKRLNRGLFTPDIDLEKLPNLKPLNCSQCGAGVLIKEETVFCPHCRKIDDLPVEYLQEIKSKRTFSKASSMYFRNWRFLYFFTTRYSTYVFYALLVLHIVVPFYVVYELSEIQDLADFLLIFQIIGIINFVFLFMIIAVSTRHLHKKSFIKPLSKTFVSREKISNCSSCGGAIEYFGKDFAVICDYCNVQNFRIKFAMENQQANAVKTASFQQSLKSVSFHLKEVFSLVIGTFWVFGGLGLLIFGFLLIIGGISIYFDGGGSPALGIIYGVFGIIITIFFFNFLRIAVKYKF